MKKRRKRMDSRGQVVKDYKERKIEVSEAVDRLRALDEKNPPHIDKNLSMEEKRNEITEILERLGRCSGYNVCLCGAITRRRTAG